MQLVSGGFIEYFSAILEKCLGTPDMCRRAAGNGNPFVWLVSNALRYAGRPEPFR